MTLRHWGVKSLLGLAMVAAVAFGVAPLTLDLLTLWAIEGILALSLVLVWGQGGIFSLGQTAIYGVGAYTAGVVAVNLGVGASNPLLFGTIAAVGVATVVTAALGYMMFYGEVSEVNIGVITLAVTLVAYALFNSLADPRYKIGSAQLGGFNGLVGVAPPTVNGRVLTPQGFFILVGVVAVLALSYIWWVQRRPFGRITAAIRSNALRAELLGYDVRARRTVLFVVGGAIAAVAGALFSSWGQFISPTVFGLKAAIVVVIWVLVGTRTSAVGAFIGVVAVEGLTYRLAGGDAEFAPVYLGLVLILAVMVLPNGLVDTARTLSARVRTRLRTPKSQEAAQGVPAAGGSAADTQPSVTRPALGELLPSSTGLPLELHAVSKQYGAVTVLNAVSLSLSEVGAHVIIGPNGAGKSTLFGVVNGTGRSNDGRVVLGGRDITRLRPHRRARAGLGTKRQVVCLFPDLSVIDNLWVAAYAPRAKRTAREASEAAEQFRTWLGLEPGATAGTLSHGEQQRLEVAMVVAAGASLVLLDEPTAGMTVEESDEMVTLIRSIAERCSVVVIDHDMAFVRKLEAPVTVMHLGKILMADTFDRLEADERLLDIYLGRHHHVET